MKGYKSTDPLLDRRQKFSAISTTTPHKVPYPVDLRLCSQKRRNLDLQEESGLEDEKSSRTTEEEVERPQEPLNALVEDFDIDTEPLDYLFCLGELLSSV